LVYNALFPSVGDTVVKDEGNIRAGEDRGDALSRESPILNHRLRGENESFWDAMDQGRAAKSKECSAMIAATLQKAGDTK
jgi:hypothetical protein